MSIKLCKKCGFILGTRPGLKDFDGVCSACINHEKKKLIDFNVRQEWLADYIPQNKTNTEYDALVAVSGGKDSTTIVRLLFEKYHVKKLLLVHVTEEFTKTKAGIHNLNNIATRYNCDLLTVRVSPRELSEHMAQDLSAYLNPLKWLEEKIYQIPIQIAEKYDIKLIFYGENPEFEYGSGETLEIFHSASTEERRIIYMGAVHPYSAQEWYKIASEVGFRSLDYYNEWQRQGQIENYSQMDSLGYQMGIWTKFVKFGYQRVSDMACRFLRDGLLTYEQAQQLIREKDYICDPASKRDFCQTIGITEIYFDEMVDKHANTELVGKDINGVWRRKDYMI